MTCTDGTDLVGDSLLYSSPAALLGSIDVFPDSVERAVHAHMLHSLVTHMTDVRITIAGVELQIRPV